MASKAHFQSTTFSVSSQTTFPEVCKYPVFKHTLSDLSERPSLRAANSIKYRENTASSTSLCNLKTPRQGKRDRVSLRESWDGGSHRKQEKGGGG